MTNCRRRSTGIGVGARGEASYALRYWPLFGVFLAYVFYHYLQVGYRVPVLGEIRFQLILGALLAMLAYPAFVRNMSGLRTGLLGWVAALILCMAVMVLFSYDVEHSWIVFVDRVIKFAMLTMFIGAFVQSPNDLRWFLAIYLLAFLKMGQEGLVGVISGSMVWENQEIPRLHGSTPVYFHPNSFSGTQLGVLPFVFYLFNLVPWYLRVVLLFQAGLVLNVVVFTGSRTGYVALALGLVTLATLARRKVRTLVLIALVGGAVSPFIPTDYLDRAWTIVEHDEPGHGSIVTREQILRDAWDIFLSNPLGVGVSAFPAVRQARFGRRQDTHNLYLEVATNLGLQGLFIFVGLVLVLLATLQRLWTDVDGQLGQVRDRERFRQGIPPKDEAVDSHEGDLKLIGATARAIYVFVVIRLGLGMFGMDLYEIYWWFAVGTTLALLNINRTARLRTRALTAGGERYDDAGSEEGHPARSRPPVTTAAPPAVAALPGRSPRRLPPSRRDYT